MFKPRKLLSDKLWPHSASSQLRSTLLQSWIERPITQRLSQDEQYLLSVLVVQTGNNSWLEGNVVGYTMTLRDNWNRAYIIDSLRHSVKYSITLISMLVYCNSLNHWSKALSISLNNLEVLISPMCDDCITRNTTTNPFDMLLSNVLHHWQYNVTYIYCKL